MVLIHLISSELIVAELVLNWFFHHEMVFLVQEYFSSVIYLKHLPV